MKAYLIDTPNKQIVEVDYDGNYKSIYGFIKADLFTVVRLNEQGDTLFVDDEGLINGNPHGWMMIENYPQPLRGYGLVIGSDVERDEDKEPSISLDELRAKVSFPNDDELMKPEEYVNIEVTGFDNPNDFLEALMGEIQKNRIPKPTD